MILISQAYVLRKIWGIKTNNKSYFKFLSKSWTFHLFIKNNFKIFLQEQGLLSYAELSNFTEGNWNEWIKQFNRYNLSPKIWYSIAPKKWRFRVSEHWKKNKVFNLNIEDEKTQILLEKIDKSSLFQVKFSVEGTKKSNKVLKKNILTYKFFDSNKNSITDNFFPLNGKFKHNNIIISKIQKYPFFFDKNRIFTDFSRSKKNIFFKYNLLLWFVPEFVEQRNKYKYKKLLDLNTFVGRHKNLEILRNKELLREREVNQSIRQWRWKSRNYEKKFRKLGSMASLMTFMQNQETMISLSGKMRKDLDLFRLFFRRNNNFNQLAINSEHRLPRLLDDQILIYKLINTSLNFKQRLKKISNLGDIEAYSFNMNIPKDHGKDIVFLNLSNLEDILLSKCRRKLRILNSLALQQKKNIDSTENILKKSRERKQKVMIDRNKMIKRFIWSSYRFEDLACMNRFWFSTMNGSRFSMLRFRMYPTI
uniref:Ycf1 n=1 Tax=Delavayella serrata TaxID=264774 RepID=A0A8F2XVE3_9MARC|nr:Ycf1 [Delavayella serrata]